MQICGPSFVSELRLRLHFVWVKGRATNIHIDMEIFTTLDKGRNDECLSLTVDGL